jgi:hypothetical protein
LKIPRLKYSGAYSATAAIKANVIQASSKTSRVSQGLATSASARNPTSSAACQRRTEETTGPQSSPCASLSATCRPSVWVAATQSTWTIRKVEFQSRAIGAYPAGPPRARVEMPIKTNVSAPETAKESPMSRLPAPAPCPFNALANLTPRILRHTAEVEPRVRDRA